MIRLSLDEAARATAGRLIGEDVCFEGVSTDSRRLAAGNLFVALEGERFDGHAFLQQAKSGGAAGAVVAREVDIALPLLEVKDTRRALADLARDWRRRHDIPVIAITGSNGKTTVKEMTTAILSVEHKLLATQGNLNNDIGVPLTLFRLDPRHEAAIIEMGANHAGEIAYLTDIARPSIAVITNAGSAHLEGFGSLEGVARAKGEIYVNLGEGIAVINADDRFAGYWRGLAEGREILTFGLEQPADVSAAVEQRGATQSLEMSTPRGRIRVDLPLPGRHNAMNALAATTVALAAGASLEAVRTGLEGMDSVKGRMQTMQCRDGITLIDDTYNANPDSLRASLEVVSAMPGQPWLVLGDMGELGGGAGDLHAEAGVQAKTCGFARLFTLGPLAARAAGAFGAGAGSYDDADALAAELNAALTSNVTLLVKGSRSMRMERVVAAVLAARGGCH